MRTKSTFPVVCERYLCDMRTIAEVKRFYSDNEAVLNSAAVDAVCRKHSIRHDNSCPYEPWQNPAEGPWKTLTAASRQFLLRGFGDDNPDSQAYWPYSHKQAADVENAIRASAASVV